jgi:hypothetical protein
LFKKIAAIAAVSGSIAIGLVTFGAGTASADPCGYWVDGNGFGVFTNCDSYPRSAIYNAGGGLYSFCMQPGTFPLGVPASQISYAYLGSGC